MYVDAAENLGLEFTKRNIALIYGGGSIGLMGRIANAVHNGGGKVLGVIPAALEPEAISGITPGRVVVTSDMHERKAIMAANSDGFVALPGGFGTLEELFEIITWRQLGEHAKPVGLLNVSGFFDSLLAFLQEVVDAGFISTAVLSNLLIDSDAARLLDRMNNYNSA